MAESDQGLIFDLGLHKGEDADFYLKKGFRVVGVDASPQLCAEVADKLRPHVESGRLTIVNKAIAKEAGSITFYNNESSVWGTVNPDWADRNARRGYANREITVEAITMADLVRDHGVPYYLKIDIEGMDLVALNGLQAFAERPSYVSIESDKDSFRELRREITSLSDLGYDLFKIVPQRTISRQKLPKPPREGLYVDHRFPFGSSGAFGEETPGRWLTADQAIEAYRPIFLRYALTGYDPFVTSRVARKLLRLAGFDAGWYDTHARHSSA